MSLRTKTLTVHCKQVISIAAREHEVREVMSSCDEKLIHGITERVLLQLVSQYMQLQYTHNTVQREILAFVELLQN